MLVPREGRWPQATATHRRRRIRFSKTRTPVAIAPSRCSRTAQLTDSPVALQVLLVDGNGVLHQRGNTLKESDGCHERVECFPPRRAQVTSIPTLALSYLAGFVPVHARALCPEEEYSGPRR